MNSVLSRCRSVVPLAVALLLTWQMLASAETTSNGTIATSATSTNPDDAGKTRTLVVTVFGEALYLEQFTPAEAESKRKELPPGEFENWLRGYQAVRIYDTIWAAVNKKYIEREKLEVSKEELAGIQKSAERTLRTASGGADDSPFPTIEQKGIGVAWAHASFIDWKLCKSLYEKYGGRVGMGSLGLWIALDGQYALLKEHQKAGDLKFHHAEIESAFWKYAQREHFADAYPKGERLKRLLASPPYTWTYQNPDAVAYSGTIVSHIDSYGSGTRSSTVLSRSGEMMSGFDYGDPSNTDWKGNIKWQLLRRQGASDVYRVEWRFEPKGGTPTHKSEELHFDGVMSAKLFVNRQWVISIEPDQPPADGSKRERIGSALGHDIYRDQLKDNPPTYHQVVKLFMAPAIEEFEQKHGAVFEMSDDEIRAGVEWMEADTKKRGGPAWESWQARSKEIKANVDKRLAEIKRQLESPATLESERSLLKTSLRVTSLEATHPHASEVWMTFHRRKFEKYLHCNYGGGRIIHQQFGPEALDARRELLLKLEGAGKFQITDPELHKLAYDYWERPNHPGGFHTDHRLLEFPWTKAHQDMIREKVGVVPDPHSPLGELMQQQKARDESIRRISYQGTVRQYAGLNVQRKNTESIDQFISRVAGLAPEYDQVPPYSLSGCRDFASGVYQFTMGDINADVPKYMSWFVDNKESVQLMGRKPGVCEAIITNQRNDIQDDREASLVRLDIAAFRPVKDKPMFDVLDKAISEPKTPEAGGRPALRLEKPNNGVGWKATFKSLHPMENPPGANQVLWYRIYWEQIEGELVIVRVDQLSVVGDDDTTPIGVILLDDHRLVNGHSVPYRVRHFRLGKVGRGTELMIADMKLNESVDVPKRMVIPEGTPVRDFISGKQYRQPADETTIAR